MILSDSVAAIVAAFAVALYLAASLWVARVFRDDATDSGPTLGSGLLAAFAVLLHSACHLLAWQRHDGLDLHFFAALSLVGLGMAALTALVAGGRRLQALGIVVYPLAAMMLLFYAFGGGQHRPQALDWPLQLHAWLALLAYATLAIAALLAIMLWAQERALRRRELRGWLRALPPLVQLETLLFRTVGTGFVLLTLALVTGVVFVENLLAQHLWHKTVLSVLSWLVFGLLLFGRWRWGWRGAKAVRLTLIAMALLGLAFFGSKFVLEVILQRT